MERIPNCENSLSDMWRMMILYVLKMSSRRNETRNDEPNQTKAGVVSIMSIEINSLTSRMATSDARSDISMSNMKTILVFMYLLAYLFIYLSSLFIGGVIRLLLVRLLR